MPVCDENIFVSVIIVIEKPYTPTEIAVRVFSDTSGDCGINEKVVPLIVVEGVGLVLKIADCDIQLTVVVVVCENNTHAGFCLPHIATTNAGE